MNSGGAHRIPRPMQQIPELTARANLDARAQIGTSASANRALFSVSRCRTSLSYYSVAHSKVFGRFSIHLKQTSQYDTEASPI